MRLYLCGPMTGRPNQNREAFDGASHYLRAEGHEVISPVELDRDKGVDLTAPLDDDLYFQLLGRDIALLADEARHEIDGGIALPGWQDSKGASLEVHVLQTFGLPVYSFAASVQAGKLMPLRHPTSERFHAVLGDLGRLHDRKQQDYGKPCDPFANVRASTEWGLPGWVGAMVRATDKVRRLQTFASRGSLANESAKDAFLDLAVYSVIAAVLYDEESDLANAQ